MTGKDEWVDAVENQMKLDLFEAKIKLAQEMDAAKRRDEVEKIYLAYATAAFQGLLVKLSQAYPDLVFDYAEQMTEAHVERFKSFWEKYNG